MDGAGTHPPPGVSKRGVSRGGTDGDDTRDWPVRQFP